MHVKVQRFGRILCYVQTDVTVVANNSQHCWMLHVAQNLKPVKL